MDILRFNRNAGFQASGEGCVIRELDVDFRTIVAVLVDMTNADDFTGEFFALDHGFLTGFTETTVTQILDGTSVILKRVLRSLVFL